jgi:GT2 family glycosyltransferase/predicted O-methyltransferase YrrM
MKVLYKLKQKIEENRNLRLIQKSTLFDKDYYFSTNPDVLASGMDPALHYLRYGSFEKRNPSENFDTQFYLDQNTDVLYSNLNPLVHYLLYGHQENRLPVPQINSTSLFDKNKFIEEKVAQLTQFLLSSKRIQLQFPEPKISIILVLYNKAELTLACLQSLIQFTDLPIELIIVDNNSSDQTFELLQRVKVAKIIYNIENLHFLQACNQALEFVTTEYTLFLNNDTEISKDSISRAFSMINKDETIGAVGAKLILPDGTLQEAGSIIWADGSCQSYGRGDDPTASQYNFVREVDYCSGAFLLTKTILIKAHGGFDIQFAPAYYEETDYCMWLHKMGYKVIYNPFVEIRHFEFGSGDQSQAMALQERNRNIFVKKHHQQLLNHLQPSEDHILKARFYNGAFKRGYLLYIDDTIPHAHLGAGLPRSNFNVQALDQLGYQVTIFPIIPSNTKTWHDCFKDINHQIEIIQNSEESSFENFISNRSSHYDFVWISRLHNLNLVADYLTQYCSNATIIYDAEAIFAERNYLKTQLIHPEISVEDFQDQIDAEIALCWNADHIISVTERDAQVFMQKGMKNVTVIGHALETSVSNTSFEDRKDLLFVGNLDNEESPNVDSINWFVNEIFPFIQTEIPNIKLHIVGSNKAHSMQKLSNEHIVLHGVQENTQPFYDQARVFIAPTRYAAGIPFKVHESASRGLPVVATELLAAQLGWEHQNQLMVAKIDPELFASTVVEIYQNKSLWSAVQKNGLEAILNQHSSEALSETIDRLMQSLEKNRSDSGFNASKVKANLELFPAGHYYSPIVSLKFIQLYKSKIWKKFPKEIPGIDLNTDNQLDQVLAFQKYYQELPFTRQKIHQNRYFFENPFYSYTDGIFLYSMIRHYAPKNIIEIGSGFSSMVMLDTNEKFFNESIKLTFIDPEMDRLYALIKKEDTASTKIIPAIIQDIYIDLFDTLDENDILFIDSSHVSKTGSDVNFILFEILPKLKKGVLIHFHDIFYPFEYPIQWVKEGRSWNETYILKSFLMYNNDFEIVVFADYLHKIFPHSLKNMPLTYENQGGNIWLKKKN